MTSRNISNHPILSSLNRLYQETKRLQQKRGNWSYVFEDATGLYNTVSKLQPSRILEFGTAIGFTSCVMALSSPKAIIDTIDLDEVNITLARHNFNFQGLSEKITTHQGDFDNVIDRLGKDYDFVFFDGFAPEFGLLEKIYQHLIPQGVFACSNLSLCHDSNVTHFLGNAAIWQELPSIEQANTRIFRKHPSVHEK
ncbi:O-methyltransferase [Serratia grimesii]|uniref:O-methyltransferase n=1 Tax=Serratia grimesii TaxID=82995 RepID=UPI00223EC3A3|nr:methyltransferase [Serratia grimesii]